MTKEEAIAFGNRVIDLGLNDDTQQFAELAVKALKQGFCEDTISRKDVLNILPTFTFNSINDYMDAKNKIEKL